MSQFEFQRVLSKLTVIVNRGKHSKNDFKTFVRMSKIFHLLHCIFRFNWEMRQGIYIEVIEFQCNETLKTKFDETPVDEFYHKYVNSNRFLRIKKNAANVISLFVSTYICKQMFLKMKHIKSKYRFTISDSHLEQCLSLSTMSIEADFDKFVQRKQSYVCH